MLSKNYFVGSFCRFKNNDFTINENGCYLCCCNLPDADSYQSHMKHHLESVKVKEFNDTWKSIGNVEVIGFTLTGNDEDLLLNVTNNSDGVLKISQIAIYNEVLVRGLVEPDAFPITLEVDNEFEYVFVLGKLCSKNHITIVYETILNNVNYEVVQSYCVQNYENESREKSNLTPDRLEERIKILPILFEELATRPPKNLGHLELGKLSEYMPTVEIKSLCKVEFRKHPGLTDNEEKLRKTITDFKGPLTPTNYYDMLTIMVQIEDYGAQVSMMQCTKRNRSLINVKDNEYILKLSEREGRPLFLLAGDKIWIGTSKWSDRIYGFVKYVSSSEIRMKMTKRIVASKEPIHFIHFQANRLPFRLQRLALETAKARGIMDCLFPVANQILSEQPKLLQLDIQDKGLKGDTNQIEAVNHIVAGTSYPLPYVLIGYPGTGKTAIIVESIYQLWKLNKNSKILVCAQSNSVCDEIGERLVTLLPKKSVRQQYNLIRLFAASAQSPYNSEDLLANSNFDDHDIPCLTELYKYRIIVTTLTISGRLLQAGMSSSHFTHLFIDECENATESFTLLPIALCSSKNKINAHVVLSGDPYQLGPVVRESMSQQMTMDVSMLKRLSEHPLYQKQTETNSYDQRITCRLRNNYRSHPDLVKMASELFYNNEMRDSIPRTGKAYEKIDWLSKLNFLPKKGFPLLFEHVDGIPETKENCSSWYNEIEAMSVLHYVETLLQNQPHEIKQSDIGIVAAYKRQVVHITECLEERNYSGIEVGTVEQFQGREKPIIIISTVRNGSLGFLQQRERINVLLTRAIGLLIIIGHTKTLRQSAEWGEIIDHTYDKCGGEIVADYIYDVGDYRV